LLSAEPTRPLTTTSDATTADHIDAGGAAGGEAEFAPRREVILDRARGLSVSDVACTW
jgi:hypothetical protein